MERNFKREDLERKTILELKQILTNRRLKSSGNKQVLIERILTDQDSDKSYFDILPTDINKMVGRYRIENEPNNKIAITLVQMKTLIAEEERNRMNKLLETIDAPFRVIEHRDRKKAKEELGRELERIKREGQFINDTTRYDLASKFGLTRPPYTEIIITENNTVTDQMLIDLIIYLLREGINFDYINKTLVDNESNLRIIRASIVSKLAHRERYRYSVGYFKTERDVDI